MKRIVSVWLKTFALDRLKWQMRRSKCHVHHGDLHSVETPCRLAERRRKIAPLPFALVRMEATGIRIAALNDAAREGGVHEGMRLTDARALLPSLATEIADPAADERVLRNLADWCQRYTPVVGIDSADGLWLDITGASHLLGSEDALLADLGYRLRSLGFPNRLGLAETPGSAWALARFATVGTPGYRIIPQGDVLTTLAPLPPAALRLDENALYLLKRFGLKTIGALCAIPRPGLQRRFSSKEIGEAVLHRLDQAFGFSPEPIVAIKTVPAYFERLSFPDPILATESFHQGLGDLLRRLCRRMEMDRKGALRLTFSAYHADGGVSRVSIATARPSRDAKHLALLFRNRIETINPGFGVDVLILSADTAASLATEQLLLSCSPDAARDEKDVSALIDRLSNRLGAGNVQRIVPRESHIPERAEVRVPALRAMALETESPPLKPPRPFRLLEHPEPVHVMAEVPEGPPMRFTWRRVTRRVISAEGPERIAPEWWARSSAQSGRTRDYYRVEDEKGHRFWLFREGLYRDLESEKEESLPTWHLHGLFT